jgi:hypothetical protein
MMQVFGDQKQRDLFNNILEKCDLECQILHIEKESQNELTSNNFFEDQTQEETFKTIHL